MSSWREHSYICSIYRQSWQVPNITTPRCSLKFY